MEGKKSSTEMVRFLPDDGLVKKVFENPKMFVWTHRMQFSKSGHNFLPKVREFFVQTPEKNYIIVSFFIKSFPQKVLLDS